MSNTKLFADMFVHSAVRDACKRLVDEIDANLEKGAYNLPANLRELPVEWLRVIGVGLAVIEFVEEEPHE